MVPSPAPERGRAFLRFPQGEIMSEKRLRPSDEPRDPLAGCDRRTTTVPPLPKPVRVETSASGSGDRATGGPEKGEDTEEYLTAYAFCIRKGIPTSKSGKIAFLALQRCRAGDIRMVQSEQKRGRIVKAYPLSKLEAASIRRKGWSPNVF